jgi:hypothetical protein
MVGIFNISIDFMISSIMESISVGNSKKNKLCGLLNSTGLPYSKLYCFPRRMVVPWDNSYSCADRCYEYYFVLI